MTKETHNMISMIMERKKTIPLLKLCFFLLIIFYSVSFDCQSSYADSLHQAGGLAIDLRTDLPYGIEMTHDGGNGPDQTYGGKLHVKLYGTIDTSNTVSITVGTFNTSGMQYALMFHIPENISADNFKAAYDKAYRDKPDNFYSISGQQDTRIGITSTKGMRTFSGSTEDGSPGWGDSVQDYSGVDTDHQVMFCQRGDSVDLSAGQVYDIWKNEPDSKAIKFELHFDLDVATLMKDGDPNDYTKNKELTKQRLPVSNVLEDGTDRDQFALSADFFGRTYQKNNIITPDTTNTVNYIWTASADMWLRSSSLLEAANKASDNKKHQIITGIQGSVPTWSSYISPWDSGDKNSPLSNYNTQDATEYPETPGTKKMLPGELLEPSFSINQRQDNPTDWTDDYVRQRFTRVINFHTHQVENSDAVSVSSKTSNLITTYSFKGKDSQGNTLVMPPVGDTTDPTDSTLMRVNKDDYQIPSIEKVAFASGNTTFHVGQEIPVVLTVKSPTTRKIQIEEKTSSDKQANFQKIGEQDLRGLTVSDDCVSFECLAEAMPKTGEFKLTFRITDLDDKDKRYSNEKEIMVNIDKASLRVKPQDTIYQYSQWNPEQEVTTLLDPDGKEGDFNEVTVSINKIDGDKKVPVDQVDTQKVGKYEINYEYLGLKAKTDLEVIQSYATIGAHSGGFSVGTKFNPEKLFDDAHDNANKTIPYSDIDVSYSPKEVNDQVPGVYTITYDISKIVGFEKKVSVTWTYFYSNQLDFYDLSQNLMKFDSVRLNGKEQQQTLSDCQMTVKDTQDPQKEKGWKLQVKYDSNDPDTKVWNDEGLDLMLNPTSVNYVTTEKDVLINGDLQLVAEVDTNGIKNKKILTELQLFPTLTVPKGASANENKSNIVWKLAATP
ncbi:hypothetical protein IGI39_001451 [Enterococcus sp. AZ135]|uniref:bacterial Ig-like domain-containing protein n=1 Tax=unclassified Enterococcus TaxID=2608891 RepID=UPI003F2318C6